MTLNAPFVYTAIQLQIVQQREKTLLKRLRAVVAKFNGFVPAVIVCAAGHPAWIVPGRVLPQHVKMAG
ncbi:hypothetical protein [Mesorhizobium salmacidum]|uniref:Transposase n=1 Tax=Mesorhizobium salmacidum TaxID=3015171 RepID=A0ABU8L4L7_9HYPH